MNSQIFCSLLENVKFLKYYSVVIVCCARQVRWHEMELRNPRQKKGGRQPNATELSFYRMINEHSLLTEICSM